MATIINNQAILKCNYVSKKTSTESNATIISMNQALKINKSSLSKTFRIGDSITYIISIINNGASLNDITVCDDLGTYQFNGNEITPLTYIGPAELFINGVYVSNIVPEINDNEIIFHISDIPSFGNIQILYLTKINKNANENIGSLITNTAIIKRCICNCIESICDSHTITAEEFSDVRIIKSLCPSPVNCGETITYTLNIYNYGNTSATDIVLTDQFDPILKDIEITLNGNIVLGTDYQYSKGFLRFPINTSKFNIYLPPAKFTQDPLNGKYNASPSMITIRISGKIQ